LEALLDEFSGRKVDTTDGLKVFFDDGWTLIRPSGTEPIFRIFSEAKSKGAAVQHGDECQAAFEAALRG